MKPLMAIVPHRLVVLVLQFKIRQAYGDEEVCLLRSVDIGVVGATSGC